MPDAPAWVGHMEAIGKPRHGACQVAGGNLGDHHHPRKRHHPQGSPGVFIARGAEIDRVMDIGAVDVGIHHRG